MIAVDNNNLPIIKFLFNNGANLNIPDNNLNTPLHNAASHQYYSILKFLVDNGADVNTKNNVTIIFYYQH
jgi:ankyrin repeat protein